MKGVWIVTIIQIRMKLYLLKDIKAERILSCVADFIDQGLMKSEEYAKLHEDNCFKPYSFNCPYPIEEDKLYKKDKIYTLTIRTINTQFAQFLAEHVVNGYTDSIKGLTAEIRIIPQKHVELLYTITPDIMRCEKGYWRDSLSIEQYEERIKVNLLKKWNDFYGEKMNEDFEFINGIEFKNKCPIKIPYKNIHLLGDKFNLYISENENAQRLANLAIGVGISELNARGMGFCNYRWL